MPILQRRVHFWLTGLLGAALLKALHATWRLELIDPHGVDRGLRDGSAPAIASYWHRHLMTFLSQMWSWRACIPVSEHPHGEFVAHVMDQVGIPNVRGSSTHGGMGAVRGMLEHVRRGRGLLITPDGPKGPRFSMQPGIALVARRSGLPVHPAGVAVRDAWVMRGWDAFVIPKPWTRMVIVYGPPLRIGSSESAEAFCRRVKEGMDAAKASAYEALEKMG